MNKSIKLIRLKLTNFARIKSGMGINVLELDFCKMPNVLSLIVGANGSGKTSLMQCIHPFPYNNCTGDNSGNAQLIIEKMDGEKIFVFEYDGYVYTCTHKYIRKNDGSLTTKSYIAENSDILDSSGSVNSFKNYIANFGLKESHFSILMIGSSLSSFVSSIASERKRISVKLFEILDIYSFFYKNASSRMKELRPVLQNATAKLAQYRGTNVYDLEKEEGQLEELILGGEQQLSNALMKLGEIKESMRNNQDAYQEKEDLENQLRCITERIDQYRSKAPDKPLATLQAELEELKIERAQLQVSYDASVQLVQSELRFKNDKLATISTLRQTSEKIQKDIDIRELEELRLSLSRQIDNLDIPPEIDSFQVSSNALLTAKIYLDGLQGRCIDLITKVEHHDDVVVPVLEQYKKQHDIVIRFEQEYAQYMQKLQSLRTSNTIAGILSASDIKSVFKTNLNTACKEQTNCPYVEFFRSIETIVTTKGNDVATKIEDAATMVDMSRDRHNAAQVIDSLYRYVEQNKDILSVISPDIFSVDTFISDYMTSRQIYNGDRLNYVIDIAERVERVQKLSKELKEVGEKIVTLSDNRNSYTALIDQIKELEKDIDVIDFRIVSVQKDIDYRDSRLKSIGTAVKSLEGKIEIAVQLEDFRAQVQDIKAKLVANDLIYKQLEVVEKNYEEMDAHIASIRLEVDKHKKRLEEIRFLRTTIFNLMQEEAEISHKLVECHAIKEAVSATDGIPVEFIETFIKKDLIQMVNEILDVVYNGQLVLDKDGTIVNDTDFKIPYFWKGTWVSDISAASDGQKAVMTIAFSEVLVIITQMAYNILMFDEMDSRLDARSKAKIIKLMEWYEHQIKPSNMFTISHNPVFDGYPVNILLTSDEVVNSVDPSNVVRCYEGGNAT